MLSLRGHAKCARLVFDMICEFDGWGVNPNPETVTHTFVTLEAHQENIEKQRKQAANQIDIMRSTRNIPRARIPARFEYRFFADTTEKATAMAGAIRVLGISRAFISYRSKGTGLPQMVSGMSKTMLISPAGQDDWVRSMCELG